MNTNLKAPPQFGGDIQEQLQQVQRYLFQLQRDLNVALDSLNEAGGAKVAEGVAVSAAKAEADKTAQSLKSLIIKTASTIQSEMDEWTGLLEGNYVAISDFGTYTENVSNEITARATEIVNTYKYSSETQQTLPEVLDALQNYKVESEQYTKQGLLYFDDNNEPVYGFAVGNIATRVIVNGVEVVRKEDLMATFSSGRIDFWMGGAVVAYYANNKMHVTDGRFLSSLQIGNWMITDNNGRLDYDWAGDE